MEEKKISYKIEYHKLLGEYILWKEVESVKGWGTIGIYKGTKSACQKYLKELKTSSK